MEQGESRMKSEQPGQDFQEIELKLALIAADASALLQALVRTPLLARRRPKQLHLHNVYYDTPDHSLGQQRVALRLRRVGVGAKQRWLQTLKIGGGSDSALSERGEWELPVPGPRLSLPALRDTPWTDIDPEGHVFAALVPCFVTTFERTAWLVRRRDRSEIEVALDLGRIEVGDKGETICELELELLAGPADALFEVARTIAPSVAVLPLSQSKSQRGYALSQNAMQLPLRARAVTLADEISPSEAARLVLRESLVQFTTNLNHLRHADDPELVHQARVGWRRFRSALRLFKPVLAEAPPSYEGLGPLLSLLGELRDFDVALSETLPQIAAHFVGADPRRSVAWQALTLALTDAAQSQRQSVRAALAQPVVGASLLDLTGWLESPVLAEAPTADMAGTEVSLRTWSRRRIARLHRQLRALQREGAGGEHRLRILAKRLRYGIEAVSPLLAQWRSQRWYRQALEIQSTIGSQRDLVQAVVLIERLDVDHGLKEFLRGFAIGKSLVMPVST